ncbi:hypothetical protein AB0M29_25475 [Streptomyces sp. NPDC051976]|uniref:hypothetical protein n=1 Tax=Streptomyces sp. NPDC051976 TaxID=3154947 RepID=UPI003428F303
MNAHLWDQEMQPYRHRLQNIPPSGRLALAVTVMDRTLEEMGPLQPGVVRDYLTASMRVAHADVRAGAGELTLSEDALDAWNDVDDQADESGTTHVMSAVLACADAPGGLSGEVLYGVLSFCYEAVRERFEESEGGPEARCGAAIAFQKARVMELLGV